MVRSVASGAKRSTGALGVNLGARICVDDRLGSGSQQSGSQQIGTLRMIHVTCNMVGWLYRIARRCGHACGPYRARLRAQGLRPIQIWVPDVRSPEFAAEAHRQSAAVASSAHAIDDQAFIDAISWDEE